MSRNILLDDTAMASNPHPPFFSFFSGSRSGRGDVTKPSSLCAIVKNCDKMNSYVSLIVRNKSGSGSQVRLVVFVRSGRKGHGERMLGTDVD